MLTRGSCEIKNHSQPHSFLEQQKWNKGRLLAGLVSISETGGDTLPSDSVWWNPAWRVQDPQQEQLAPPLQECLGGHPP